MAHPLLPLKASVRQDRPDLSAALPKMQMPVLLYDGDQDARHEDIARCVREIAHARFASVPGLDHLTGFGRRDLIVPLVRGFLDEQRAEADNPY